MPVSAPAVARNAMWSFCGHNGFIGDKKNLSDIEFINRLVWELCVKIIAQIERNW